MSTFTVITRATYEAASRDEVLAVVTESFDIFRRQPGLLSAGGYHLVEKRQVLTVLEWESEAAHLACMESEDFQAIGPRWGALLEEGRMTWELDPAETLHRTPLPDAPE